MGIIASHDSLPSVQGILFIMFRELNIFRNEVNNPSLSSVFGVCGAQQSFWWLEVYGCAMRVMSSDAEECGRLDVAMGTKDCQEYLMSSFGTEGRMLTVETLPSGFRGAGFYC